MTNEHFRSLERMYGTAECNKRLSPNLVVGEGSAEIRMQIQEMFFHSAHAVHGSYYFKLLDDAAFFAVNSLVESVFVLTVSFNIQLLQPISKGELCSVGKVIRKSKNIFFAEAVLTSSQNAEIARGSGVFAMSKIALTKEVGYY